MSAIARAFTSRTVRTRPDTASMIATDSGLTPWHAPATITATASTKSCGMAPERMPTVTAAVAPDAAPGANERGASPTTTLARSTPGCMMMVASNVLMVAANRRARELSPLANIDSSSSALATAFADDFGTAASAARRASCASTQRDPSCNCAEIPARASAPRANSMPPAGTANATRAGGSPDRHATNAAPISATPATATASAALRLLISGNARCIRARPGTRVIPDLPSPSDASPASTISWRPAS